MGKTFEQWLMDDDDNDDLKPVHVIYTSKFFGAMDTDVYESEDDCSSALLQKIEVQPYPEDMLYIALRVERNLNGFDSAVMSIGYSGAIYQPTSIQDSDEVDALLDDELLWIAKPYVPNLQYFPERWQNLSSLYRHWANHAIMMKSDEYATGRFIAIHYEYVSYRPIGIIYYGNYYQTVGIADMVTV